MRRFKVRIELDGDCVITSDSQQFILNTKSISNGEKNKGKEILKSVAYQTTLNGVLNSYLNKMMLSSQATTIKELLKEVKELKEYIGSVLK